MNLIFALTLAIVMAQVRLLGDTLQQPEGGEKHDGPPLLEANVDTSYTFGGGTKFRGVKSGNSDAFNANINASTSVKLNENWSIPFELQSQNFALGTLTGVPLPDKINTLEFGTGLAYQSNDSWMFMARINPGLYKFEDVGENDISISGGLMAMWDYNPSLKFMFGLMLQPDNELPVMPLVGVDWQINEKWELQLMFPKPRVVYSLDDKWKFHAGMEMLSTTFRASDTLGTSIGQPQYNDALGSYTDIRIGGGASYQLSKSLSMEAEVGYSVSRQIDYTRIEEKVEFDPAPYVRVGLRLEF